MDLRAMADFLTALTRGEGAHSHHEASAYVYPIEMAAGITLRASGSGETSPIAVVRSGFCEILWHWST